MCSADQLAARRERRRGGFNSLEIIIVIVVFGVLAAIAIPRMSRGASVDRVGKLKADLQLLRTAIQLYQDDHDHLPASVDTGFVGAEAYTTAAFVRHLTMYSDARGIVAPTPSERFCFGPYLYRGVPSCSVAAGAESQQVFVITAADELPSFRTGDSQFGWVYNASTGFIVANSSEIGPDRIRFDRY